jgi:hypothetical protein
MVLRHGQVVAEGWWSPYQREGDAGAGPQARHDDTFTVKACFHDTPFCATLGLRFAGDALVFDREMNVGFGPTKRPTVVGLPRRSAASARPKS